jgi:hypothetical protein
MALRRFLHRVRVTRARCAVLAIIVRRRVREELAAGM